jgi:hypothetical protein
MEQGSLANGPVQICMRGQVQGASNATTISNCAGFVPVTNFWIRGDLKTTNGRSVITKRRMQVLYRRASKFSLWRGYKLVPMFLHQFGAHTCQFIMTMQHVREDMNSTHTNTSLTLKLGCWASVRRMRVTNGNIMKTSVSILGRCPILFA